MRRFTLILGMLMLVSCASSLPSKYQPELGAQYLTASWYGQKFHGRPTSSGERYDMYKYTAAHKTLKFGTKLRVTNPDNQRSVVVTVNDRGPFIRGRDLDLSYGAAREIGLIRKGVGRVKVEFLDRDMRYAKRIPYVPGKPAAASLTIQVGSFAEKANAFRLKQGLAYQYKDVYITTVVIRGKRFYRVKVGTFSSYDRAYAAAEKLADEGYSTLIMKRN